MPIVEFLLIELQNSISYFIRVSELFYEFKILGVHNISDPKRLGKDQLKFKGLEMKIEEENS